MASLTSIREAMAASLSGLDNVQVSAYMLASPTPPTIHLYPGGPAGDFEYDQTMRRGLDLVPFTVQAFVALGNGDLASQRNLDAFLATSGTQSVKAALQAPDSTDENGNDTVTLGGLIEGLHVVRCLPYQQFVFEGRGPLLGAEWHVNVYAPGV